MILPKITIENKDNLSEVDSVESLYQKFIIPIDRIRSLANVNLASISLSNIELNNQPQESRAHTFYRMIGLPVVSKNNLFYNPGFGIDTNLIQKENIDKNLHDDLLKYSILRENYVLTQKNIFKQQSSISNQYALSLRNIKPFNTLELEGSKFTINNRTNVHYLFPFIVDARLSNSVAPDYFQVCTPFLTTKNQTQISNGKFLNKPILELVLTQRLQQASTNLNTTKQIQQIFKDNNLEDIFSSQDLLNLNLIEILMISNLTKTIKSVIWQLKKSITQLNYIITQTNLSSLIIHTKGPEFIGSYLNSISNANLPLDLKIQNLLLNKIVSENTQQLLNNTQDFYFSNSGIIDDTILLQNELDILLFQRSFYNKQALQLLKQIEIVTGEVSGLGLIDILCMYAALWSLDINNLINFLDNSAFNRLYQNNKTFRTTEINNRFNGQTINIIDVLLKFKSLVSDLLSFADQEYQK